MRALAWLMIVGCIDQPNPPLLPTSCSARGYFAENLNNRVDILFVIDDSPAMSSYFNALLNNAVVFTNILTDFPIPLDMRIAVARASDGALADPVPCGAQPGTRWIADADSGQQRNYDGTLQDVFSCLLRVGTSGGSEQPLAAANAALAANPDFLRDKAYLFMVVITAQDDASPDDPLTYYRMLAALESSPNHFIGSVVTHLPTSRLQSFIDAFGNLGTITSIDQPNWASAFAVIAWHPDTYPRQCIDGKLTQTPWCSFTRVQYIGTAMQQEIGVMPACDPNGQTSGACAAVIPNPNCYPSGMMVAVCYNGFDPTNPSRPCPYGTNYPEDEETVVVECAVECQ